MTITVYRIFWKIIVPLVTVKLRTHSYVCVIAPELCTRAASRPPHFLKATENMLLSYTVVDETGNYHGKIHSISGYGIQCRVRLL